MPSLTWQGLQSDPVAAPQPLAPTRPLKLLGQIRWAIDGRPPIHSLPFWLDTLLVWGMGISGGLLIWSVRRPLYVGVAGAGAIVVWSQDESNPGEKKIIYQNFTIAAASTPGTIRIALPKSSPILVTNKPYRWFLELNMACTSGQRPIFVEGWIQRTELNRNLSDQIDRATPTEKVSLYAENGLWHDALTTLANLRATKPQDPGLTRDWQNLLNAIGLGDLTVCGSRAFARAYGRCERQEQ